MSKAGKGFVDDAQYLELNQWSECRMGMIHTPWLALFPPQQVSMSLVLALLGEDCLNIYQYISDFFS